MKLQSHIRKKRWNNDSTPQDQFLNYVCVCVCAHTFAQSCPTLCNPMDCSPPVSSVHEILQVRILKWIAICFSRGPSWPRDRTHVSCIGRWILYHWVLGKLWIFLFSDPSDTLCFFLFPPALQGILHGTCDCWWLIPTCSYFQVPGEISSLNCHCLM